MISLHDTAVGRPVELVPREPGKFSLYACGPTVYDLPHLGHGRAILSWDILRRALEWLGFEVTHVSNITDIDDKIIERAGTSKTSAEALAAKYEAEWWSAVDALGAHRPHHQPRATEFVPRMVELIGELINRGIAYDTDHTVYFYPSSGCWPGRRSNHFRPVPGSMLIRQSVTRSTSPYGRKRRVLTICRSGRRRGGPVDPAGIPNAS